MNEVGLSAVSSADLCLSLLGAVKNPEKCKNGLGRGG